MPTTDPRTVTVQIDLNATNSRLASAIRLLEKSGKPIDRLITAVLAGKAPAPYAFAALLGHSHVQIMTDELLTHQVYLNLRYKQELSEQQAREVYARSTGDNHGSVMRSGYKTGHSLGFSHGKCLEVMVMVKAAYGLPRLRGHKVTEVLDFLKRAHKADPELPVNEVWRAYLAMREIEPFDLAA